MVLSISVVIFRLKFLIAEVCCPSGLRQMIVYCGRILVFVFVC